MNKIFSKKSKSVESCQILEINNKIRLVAICLGQKEVLTDNYETLEELENAIFEKFQKCLIKKNSVEKRVNFILTYIPQTKADVSEVQTTTTDINVNQEKLLDDINIIKIYEGQIFNIYVKRIWDNCCACLSSFGITSNQIPYECPNEDCNYQYCRNCVQKMKKINQKNKEIYCMYCTKSSSEGPRENQLLLNLLWKKYLVKYGVDSILKTNIMPGILINEIDCRIIHLKSLVRTLKGNFNENNFISEPIDSVIEQTNILIKQLESVKKKVDEFWLDATIDIDENILTNYSNEYIELLNGNRECEYFITLCEQLLYYNQQAVFQKYFPLLNNKMNEWEDLSNVHEQFQPKIIDAFKALEDDLGHHIIPSIPCKVGLIGNISVGKTSLLNWFRTNESEDQNNDILISPVRVGKSTYCRLEFEHEYNDSKKIIFVDIEGSTDTDTHLKSANYFDEITKADCDLYLIIFDNQFTNIQHEWKKFIEEKLNRQCWLVRNKIDELFYKSFEENVHQNFHTSPDTFKIKFGKKIFDEIRDEVSIDINGNKLSNVYLTFTSNDKNLSNMFYINEELERLKKNIQELPLNLHSNRLQKMASSAMARVINNCFRRGYVVNIMKYKIAAGIASIIPFADLIARYYGREEIRQEFGINTRSHLMNKIYGTTDEFKDYLKKFDITVNELTFQTSVFNNTIQRTSTDIQNLTSVAVRSATVAGVAGFSLTDDILRGTGIITTNAVRGLSATLIIAGGVLTVGMCAWAAVSNGKQMYDYLNRLCDDLIVLSQYVTAKIILDNNSIRDSYLEKN